MPVSASDAISYRYSTKRLVGLPVGAPEQSLPSLGRALRANSGQVAFAPPSLMYSERSSESTLAHACGTNLRAISRFLAIHARLLPEIPAALVSVQLFEAADFGFGQLLAPDDATHRLSRLVVLHVEVNADNRVDGISLAHRASEPHRSPVGSGDGKTRRAGPSGAVASLVVGVLRVTRQVTGRRCCKTNGL